VENAKAAEQSSGAEAHVTDGAGYWEFMDDE
jgi:hypothetical protein